ncbi:MAG: hypothetical protein RL172_2925 [Bacteroidota bacterium]|jgi:hypothetical protein
MKSFTIAIALVLYSSLLLAQGDFKTQISTAKKSYTAGKLEDAHFALQQALQELDMIIGKEVLKLMPQKFDTLAYNVKDDRVAANIGFIGATIHRSYGKQNKVDVEIINNSPLVNTLNALLNSSMLGGLVRDEKTKVVKVQGYKSRLERQSDEVDGKADYQLQIPFNNALMTLTAKATTEQAILNIANGFALAEIAKLIQ